MKDQLERVRVDKWLWAARFYKTRQLAIKAIKNSQIKINNQTVKPATNVAVGDIVDIKKGLHQSQHRIRGLQEKRGSATIAQTLYEETPESMLSAKKLKELLANQPKIEIDQRKPDKRDLRSNRAFKRGE